MAESTINFGGLASGLDTNTIVDQLMSIERQPQNRLKLKQGAIDARKSALSDVMTRLKNLRTAAQDLKSPTLWLDTQTVDVNDATKMAATRTGGAGTGAYQVTVTQLASASQHWYSYPTPAPAGDNTLTFGYKDANGVAQTKQITVADGSDITAAANTINSDAGSPVYASVVTSGGVSKLAFSSKLTGDNSDFSLTDSLGVLSEDGSKYVKGVNAKGDVGGHPFDEPTNTVTSGIPGVSLTLKGVTGATAVTVTVGAPAADQKAISDKVKAFADQYNSTVDFIRGKLSEKPVVNPSTAADYTKGVLYGDTALTGLLGQLRIAVTDQFGESDGNPTSMDQMSELGISTGNAIGSGTLNQDSIAGKLTFDANKFAAALSSNSTAVRKMLGGNTTVTDNFAKKVDDLLAPMVQADGTLDQSIRIQDSRKRDLTDQIARMDTMLAKKQQLLKSQFSAMEAAMQSSQSQGQWLSGQLSALNKR